MSLEEAGGDPRPVVVVGAGVMGAATAWQLARRGRRVVLLDRFPAGHVRGASHGASRIYRQAHTRGRPLRLAAAALPLWRALEAETGVELLRITGGLDHGDPATLVEIAGVLAAHDVRYEWLDPDRATRRWPGLRFAGPVLHQPDRAGRLHADRAVAAFTAAAQRHGAQVRRPVPVGRIEVTGADEVRVHTPDDVLTAARVVVAAGAWTAHLLSGVVPVPPLRVTQEQPACFPTRTPQPPDGPTVIHHGAATAFALPDAGGRVKAGFHGGGPECDPDRRTFAPEPDAMRALQDYVADWLPGLDPARPEPISCTYTTAPDARFVLERHGPVVVGAGFAGEGFKHAPAVGAVLADLATDRLADAVTREGAAEAPDPARPGVPAAITYPSGMSRRAGPRRTAGCGA